MKTNKFNITYRLISVAYNNFYSKAENSCRARVAFLQLSETLLSCLCDYGKIITTPECAKGFFFNRADLQHDKALYQQFSSQICNTYFQFASKLPKNDAKMQRIFPEKHPPQELSPLLLRIYLYFRQVKLLGTENAQLDYNNNLEYIV